MAKYDHGGGCPCGLHEVCNCKLETSKSGNEIYSDTITAATARSITNSCVNRRYILESISDEIYDAAKQGFSEVTYVCNTNDIFAYVTSELENLGFHVTSDLSQNTWRLIIRW